MATVHIVLHRRYEHQILTTRFRLYDIKTAIVVCFKYFLFACLRVG